MNGTRLVRGALVCLCTVILLASVAYAGEPTEQVRQTVDKVLGILRDKALKGPARTEERRALIRKAVDERFDFEEMARRSLALHWKKRMPEEQREFVSLYSDLLERAYIKKIEDYTDEKVLYTGEQQEGNRAAVRTTIVTKKNIEIPIEYRLHRTPRGWEVYDVIIEGVSLVNNYRKQFNSIINSRSYEELVKRLKSKKPEEQFEEPK
ncbi:MAG: ABC transporter substrate-binding protein [Nitrospirota bacterium]